MNLKIGKIEAIFLILIVMINKILLNIPKEIIKQSKTGTPINLIYTSILVILLTLLICKLLKKFPNEDIIDISEYIGKKPLQILIGTAFIILFTIIIITVIYEFSNLLELIYFSKTPTYLIFIIFLGCMGVANKIGFKAIIKANSVIIPIILLSLIIIFFGTFKDLNFTRLNPILGENIQTTFIERKPKHIRIRRTTLPIPHPPIPKRKKRLQKNCPNLHDNLWPLPNIHRNNPTLNLPIHHKQRRNHVNVPPNPLHRTRKIPPTNRRNLHLPMDNLIILIPQHLTNVHKQHIRQTHKLHQIPQLLLLIPQPLLRTTRPIPKPNTIHIPRNHIL